MDLSPKLNRPSIVALEGTASSAESPTGGTNLGGGGREFTSMRTTEEKKLPLSRARHCHHAPITIREKREREEKPERGGGAIT